MVGVPLSTAKRSRASWFFSPSHDTVSPLSDAKAVRPDCDLYAVKLQASGSASTVEATRARAAVTKISWVALMRAPHAARTTRWIVGRLYNGVQGGGATWRLPRKHETHENYKKSFSWVSSF